MQTCALMLYKLYYDSLDKDHWYGDTDRETEKVDNYTVEVEK